jgi:glycosyltransferase involved in cell wall biosynthesis
VPSRILVDLLGVTGGRGGTETYAREILTRLPALLPDTEFVALTGRAGAAEVSGFFPGRVRILRRVGADRVSWAAGAVLRVDRVARAIDADLVWCPANFGPIRRGVPRVVTIHDAIYHEARGGIVTRIVSGITSWLMTRSAATADAVITVSQAAARAIETSMRIPVGRVTVVPNGSSVGTAPENPGTILAPLSIDTGRRMVLSTGNRLAHKNFDGLLRAIATIPRSDRPLVVVTGGAAVDPLIALRRELGLDDDVVLPGWVTADQLEALYAAADLYVCPSLAEGFGLPVVDALRRGVPVVANDIPVLREVGGECAAYADATDPAAFGDAVSAALSAPAGPEDRSAAQAWAASFTWEKAAAGTAAVLAQVQNRRQELPR